MLYETESESLFETARIFAERPTRMDSQLILHATIVPIVS